MLCDFAAPIKEVGIALSLGEATLREILDGMLRNLAKSMRRAK